MARQHKQQKHKGRYNKKQARKHAQQPQRTFKVFLVKWAFVLFIWGLIGVSLTIAWYGAELPKLVESTKFERQTSVALYDDRGNRLIRYGESKGESIDVGQLPSHAIHAVLAIEDRRFYKHFGLDPEGLMRATVVNLVKGRVVQGGSTITQQLAKNLFLSHDRTIKRKVQEVILALWLEKELSKDEILSAYLNRVYFGAGAYGISAAAQTYFQKQPADLSLYEAATLAGLLKAPSYYNPLSHPQRAEKRTKTVLAAMKSAGYLYSDENGSLALPAGDTNIPARKPSAVQNVGYFSDYVMSALYDITGHIAEDVVVNTTLDQGLQAQAERALTQALARYKSKNVTQGAIILMTRDGALKAMVGGKSYNDSQFNRATQAMRSPGSAFKPFIYLTALQQGWSQNDRIMDSPFDKGSYQPANYNNDYAGLITLNKALRESRNTAAVRLLENVGIKSAVKTLRAIGVEEDLPKNMSLALGSPGIPLISLVKAYAVIANQGEIVTPYAVQDIQSAEGAVIYERGTPLTQTSSISKKALYELSLMMEDVITEGTGKRASVPFRAAGKTGTSQYHRDAWFIGFTDHYVAGVWLGNDDNSPMFGISGGGAPAEIWKSLITEAHKNTYIARNKRNEGHNPLSKKASYVAADDKSGAASDDRFEKLIEALTPSFLSSP